MSPYIRADETIHNMCLVIQWISDLSDERLIRRELSCAGFDGDDIEQYVDCAIRYVEQRRKLFTPHNQMVINEN